jgi:transcriptional regulator with XRE-family HTH domain
MEKENKIFVGVLITICYKVKNMENQRVPTPRQLFFNCALRQALADSGLSQGKLAKRVGVSQPQINRILKMPQYWGREEHRIRIVHELKPELDFEQFLEYGKDILFSLKNYNAIPEYIANFIINLQNKHLDKTSNAFDSLHNMISKPYQTSQILNELEARFNYIISKATFDEIKIIKFNIDNMYQQIKARGEPTIGFKRKKVS